MMVWISPYKKILIVLFVYMVSTSCIKFCKHETSDKEIMQATNQFDSTYSLKYRRAYYQGMQEAGQEIKELKMTMYIAGLIPPQSDNIDKETGLPMKMIAGCLITDSIDGLMQGHNDEIKKYMKLSEEINRTTNHLDSTYSFDYRNGYFRGMQEAYDEIKDNKVTRYVYGKANWGDVDKETGIPIKIIAGCIIPDSIMGRVEGHNYIIIKYLNHEIR